MSHVHKPYAEHGSPFRHSLKINDDDDDDESTRVE